MKKLKKTCEKFNVYINYLISSGIAFFLDLSLYTIFITLFDDKISRAILISSYLARAISSFVNYLINKHKVFKYNQKENNTMFQYFILVIINITISSFLVSKLCEIIPIHSTIIKTVIDIGIFVSNFFIQKLFIFNNSKKEMKYKKFILCILSFIAIFIRFNKNGIIFNYEIYEYVEMLIIFPLLYYFFKKLAKKENIKLLSILAIIFSLLMVFGYSYNNVGTLGLLISSDINILVTIIKFSGFYILIKNILDFIYVFFSNYKFKEGSNKILEKFNKHPFLYSFILLLIVYSIYFIAFYPGVINYDNANQIKEVMGMHTRYLDSIVVLNEDITLTNFNPIIHTLLLGNLFKLGNSVGNVNFGLFLYTLIQVLIVVTALSYSICFLHKEKVRNGYLIIMLAIYILVPFFPFYAITAVKDTLFSMAVLVYSISLYKFIKYKTSLMNVISLIIVMLLVILLRNNGIYLILLSFPFTFFIKKDMRLKILLITLLILSFNFAYAKVLTGLEIPNVSIREALSIPFQQTARYVKYYDEEVTDKEKAAIDKILTYDTLGGRYTPELSDKVKNEYNRYATNDELKNYLEVWGKMLVKKPMTYINATVNNIYGYFYPDTYKWYIYTKLNEKLPEAGFDYHYNDLSSIRKNLSGYGNCFKYIPILKLLVNCAFYTWAYIVLLVMLILKKKKEFMIILFPAFALLLTTMAGPANTYFRYVIPYAITFPLIVGLVLKQINKSFTEEK